MGLLQQQQNDKPKTRYDWLTKKEKDVHDKVAPFFAGMSSSETENIIFALLDFLKRKAIVTENFKP